MGLAISVLAALSLATSARAADLSDAQKLYNTGQYAQCIDACSKAIAGAGGGGGEFADGWHLLKGRSQLATGQYEEALQTYLDGEQRYPWSLDLRLLGFDALRLTDKPADAEGVLTEIRSMAEVAPARFDDAADQVSLGRIYLLGGGDARQVLELFYDKAKKAAPDAPEAYIASGELALEKHDFALAADEYREAIKRAPDNPEVYLGLAKALDTDAEQATAALNKALELNPNHVPSLVFAADNQLDREEYAQADATLKKALDVNPKDASVWAYRAVLANLTGDPKQELANREQALATWKTNPEVDHLIGWKLSRDYRFAEGAAYQRKSLAFSPTYLPAKAQLCEDLLRLGKEEEGWTLAAEVFKEDPYNVLAYNFVTLHDTIAKFQTLNSSHFVVRMDPNEAKIYGQQVLDLLERARKKLCAKYDVDLPESTIVEIFPQQKDFAIRTFGMPGGGDFLGVCFGPVVTATSPATRMANPSNWEAVLWHEFCHSVTLHKTLNKMPRWLSEGISVYEESQENASWGQRMLPAYRDMILSEVGGKMTPVSKLSSAFMNAESSLQLMFAYYESSMVVEYANKRFGPDAVRLVLADIGNDISINEALSRHTEPIEKLDADFAAWLHEQAEQLAPKVDWERPKLPPDADSSTLAAWNAAHPNNFAGLLMQANVLLQERKWNDAKEPLENVLSIYPAYAEADSAYPMLAAVYRQLGDAVLEKDTLEQYASRNADAIDARLRLADLAAADKDWREVRWQAQKALAINPLIPAPHRMLALAAEALGDRATAMEAHRALLVLDPTDGVEQHYRLSKLLFEENQLAEARREVDLSLEEAPRFRDAHRLLLDIADKMDGANAPAATSPATEPALSVPQEKQP